MTIFRYTFPIPDYYGEAVFFRHVYIESEDGYCPTKEMVKAVLIRKREEEQKYPEANFGTDELGECLKCLEIVEEFPWLSSKMTVTNSFCMTKWGNEPLSVQKHYHYKIR